MDSRRYKFNFANETFLSNLCDVFEENVPKSYLGDGVEATSNLRVMTINYPPLSIHYNEEGTNKHVTCGPLFLLLKEIAKKAFAKYVNNSFHIFCFILSVF